MNGTGKTPLALPEGLGSGIVQTLVASQMPLTILCLKEQWPLLN